MTRVTTMAVSLCFVVCFALGGSALASDDDFKIIVHRSNPLTSVDAELLRDAYLRKVTRWKDGEAIHPIDLPKNLPQRDRFTREVLKKMPAQLRNYWLQRIFSGTDSPPPEAPSTAAAVAYVVAHKGAVAYVPTSADVGTAKVIKLQ